MKISCLAEQMRWMCGFSWAKRRQEAHIHNLRCGQKWSDHMQCVCSLVSCSFLCIHHTCVYSFLLQSRLYMNKHKRQLESLIEVIIPCPSHPSVVQRWSLCSGFSQCVSCSLPSAAVMQRSRYFNTALFWDEVLERPSSSLESVAIERQCWSPRIEISVYFHIINWLYIWSIPPNKITRLFETLF